MRFLVVLVLLAATITMFDAGPYPPYPPPPQDQQHTP